MSPTSYRAAPPRVSEEANYSKAFRSRQTLCNLSQNSAQPDLNKTHYYLPPNTCKLWPHELHPRNQTRPVRRIAQGAARPDARRQTQPGQPAQTEAGLSFVSLHRTVARRSTRCEARPDTGRSRRGQVLSGFYSLRPVPESARGRPYLRHRNPRGAGQQIP